MKLTDLHAKLGELIEQGCGDLRVIDNNGNDVAEVHPPFDDDGDEFSDDRTVMLSCYVECRR